MSGVQVLAAIAGGFIGGGIGGLILWVVMGIANNRRELDEIRSREKESSRNFP